MALKHPGNKSIKTMGKSNTMHHASAAGKALGALGIAAKQAKKSEKELMGGVSDVRADLMKSFGRISKK